MQENLYGVFELSGGRLLVGENIFPYPDMELVLGCFDGQDVFIYQEILQYIGEKIDF